MSLQVSNSLYAFDPNLPYLLEGEFPNPWQMTRWEKYAFISLVSRLQPEVAIEIGNATGGSLQVLSRYCKKVYALDLSPAVHDKLRKQFSENVEYHTGYSTETLPEVLKKISSAGEKLGFVFIDGDHTTEGVKADINNILRNYVPVADIVIVFHDSYHPVCRKGIIEADWQACPYVHFVDIDFIPGQYYPEQLGAAESQSLWNGFSLAYLRPEKRTGKVEIRQSLQPTFDILYKHSRYNSWEAKYKRFRRHLSRLLKGK